MFHVLADPKSLSSKFLCLHADFVRKSAESIPIKLFIVVIYSREAIISDIKLQTAILRMKNIRYKKLKLHYTDWHNYYILIS